MCVKVLKGEEYKYYFFLLPPYQYYIKCKTFTFAFHKVLRLIPKFIYKVNK